MIELNLRERYGKVAYQGYCDTTGGKSLISGALLPPWEKLDEQIREAWRAAAYSVLELRAHREEQLRKRQPEINSCFW